LKSFDPGVELSSLLVAQLGSFLKQIVAEPDQLGLVSVVRQAVPGGAGDLLDIRTSRRDEGDDELWLDDLFHSALISHIGGMR